MKHGENPLPHSDEAEAAVIGSIFLDPSIFPEIRSRVEAADFFSERNRIVFQAYSDLYDEMASNNATPSLEHLYSYLSDKNQLDQAGGAASIMGYEMAVFSTGAAPEQAEIVSEMARRRDLIDIARWIDTSARGNDDSPADAPAIAAKASVQTSKIKGFWSIPRPLGFGDLPEFPVQSTFPPWLSSMSIQVAKHLQVPIDLPAMIALGCAAAALSKKIVVAPRRDWKEQLCLWCIPCLETGNRKTGALALMDAPLRKYSNDRVRDWKKNQRIVKEKKVALSKKLAGLMKRAADGDDEAEREATEVNDQLERIDRDNAQERILAEDVTPEALESILAANNERIAIKSDEAGFFKSLGRYSDNTQVDLINKAYSGAEHYRDRVGSGFSHLRAPCLTLILVPQPKILKDRVLQDERDSGLPARCLFALPTSMIGRRDTNPPDISVSIRQDYFENMMKLCQLEWNDIDGERHDPHIVRMSGEASDALNQFAEYLEPLIAEDGKYYEFADWARKAIGTTCRISAILHCLENVYMPRPWDIQISQSTMHKAISIVKNYLIPHAEAAFAIIDNSSKTAGAEAIIRWIQRDLRETFTAREAQRGCASTFRGPDAQKNFWNSIGHLQDLDYIREAKTRVDVKNTNQRQSPIFRTNPHILDKNHAKG